MGDILHIAYADIAHMYIWYNATHAYSQCWWETRARSRAHERTNRRWLAFDFFLSSSRYHFRTNTHKYTI